MAIARALPGFNNLRRSVTPIFLLMDHFLYRFSTFREKWRKSIYRKMHHRIQFFLALRSPVRRISLEGLRLVKTLLPFETQRTHFYKIWLRSFAFVDSPSNIFYYSSCRSCGITCTVFFKIRVVSTRFISETKSVTPNFFAFSTQVAHYLTVVKL